MDFSSLNLLNDEEVTFQYDDLISDIPCSTACGCTYYKGNTNGIGCGVYYASGRYTVCCPDANKYYTGTGSIAYHCQVICNQVGLVDWFYG